MRTIRRRRSAAAGSRGFTLVELLVTIALILILVAASIPAIGRILESINYSASINAVTATLGRARSLAKNGELTAVVFLYDTETEIFSLQIVRAVDAQPGSLTRDRGAGETAQTVAHLFEPLPGETPVELPPGFGVFGLPNYIEDDPQSAQVDSVATAGWYAGDRYQDPETNVEITPWVFPRNDPRIFLDPEEEEDGDPWWMLDDNGARVMYEPSEIPVRNAMTFCVHFTPDGGVADSFTIGGTTLVEGYIEYATPIECEQTGGPGEDERGFDPEHVFMCAQPDTEPSSNPEVRIRTAAQLAIVDLERLQNEASDVEPWRLQSGDSLTAPEDIWPPLENELGEEFLPEQRDAQVRRVTEWIEVNAEVIGFNRLTGTIAKR